MKLISRSLGSLSILLLSSWSLSSLQAATINVTDPNDAFGGGVCSLRNAIESINNGGDFGGCVDSTTDGYGTNDTIALTAQTYVLSLGTTNEDDNADGDLDISATVNIIGAGPDQTTVSGSGFPADEEDRVFHVVELINGSGGFTPSITVNIEGLTIRDGDGTFNNAAGAGLAIEFSQAAVNLTDVIVTANECDCDGGGLYNNNGVLILNNTLVSANVASSDGGALDNDSTAMTVIQNSTLDGNFAPDDGGAIQNSGGFVLISNSTISRNSCVEENSPELVIAGGSDFQGDGGGIINISGTMLLVNSTVSNNEAGFQGGGIFVPSNVNGGGPSFVALFNVTVADNTVLSVDGFGGGLCHDCTILPGGTTGSEFELTNTLVASNDAANSPDCGGDYISNGYNLVGDIEACNGFTATGDQTGVADAGIGPLQNNGGPTETHALLEGSPAIDRANDVEGCQGPIVQDFINTGGTINLAVLDEDQRAFLRPVAVLDPALAICDIGAYEFQVPVPTPTPTPTATATPTPPFQGFIEGSGCSLNPAAAPAAISLWLALGLAAGFLGLRKKARD
ncbi:MAG TPA: choice-of-anchor Q domain-containing protein [bacterium]|nr:choice-of-anchor Q domain-containing protein [bacterium]